MARRKEVKNHLKSEKNEFKKGLLETKQKAYKLIANSIYGCLGFKESRFYAQPIAALITSTGRELLNASANLVRNKFNFDIVYGDTDSIMIDVKTSDIK